ncbi:MAG: hypothetical protein DMG09_04530 [Acidobacteria bacterium]|nr:MAG: hypothetical protein DMG09_04530 [Acidobacteriota bacterium]
MSEKLKASDYRFILLCLGICAASLFIGIRYFYRAFPEASIDFRVTRDSSLPLAETFLSSQGFSTPGYRHAAMFRYDDEAKVFLERELGLEKANALMGRDLRLWRWAHRWFKPLQKEEFRVEVTTRGEIASFLHSLPEDAGGEDLTAAQARGVAESFLALQMGRDLDSLEFVDSQSQKMPRRTDHVFTWKVAGMEYQSATYRISVAVNGDRVDGYSEFLKIPEEWTRGYARLRSLNESTAQVDLLFFVFLGIAMLVTLSRRVRAKDVRWKTALALGSMSFVLQFLASLNLFPLSEYRFDTTGSYGSFVGRTLFSAVLSGMTLGGIILLLTACSEPVYRQAYPQHLAISRMFRWNAIRTRRFFIGSLAGITLTFFFFAYEIGFYLAAKRLGAWSPAELPYTDLLNTRFPWIFVLLGGFFPAVSEEWMFRAFSIPYLRGLLRYRWPAIFLSSFIWGFGHANYPNQPFFIRGIEVGIVGLILSWAMLRFGILAPLIAHYSIDAFYSAFLLLRSGNTYLIATGAITAGINLIPVLLAIAAYIATREFRSDNEATNAAEGTIPAQPEEAARAEPRALPTYLPLSRKSMYAAFGILALGVLALTVQPPRFGDSSRFRISASQAEKAANEFLSRMGFEAQTFRRITQPANRTDAIATQYVYSKGGIARLNQIYEEQTPALAWQTRFYKPLEKEEFRVNVDPAKEKAAAFRHSLPEDAPGADLTEGRAREIAAEFLKARGYDLGLYELKETKSERLKGRRDTEFVWEARSGTPGALEEARVRLQVSVVGDTIGTWTHFVKIPEEYRRMRQNQNFYSISVIVVRVLFFGVLLALAMGRIVGAVRLDEVRWTPAIRVALAAGFLEVFHTLNSARAYWFQYDSTSDMGVFALTMIVEMIMVIVGIALTVALATVLVIACYPDSTTVLRGECRRLWGRDAVIATIAVLGAYLILQGITSQMQYRASSLALAPSISLPANLEAYVPIVSVIRDALLLGIFCSAILAFGVHLWTRVATRGWFRFLLAAGLIVSLLPLPARRPSEAALEAIQRVLFVLLAGWLVPSFFRNNYLAYFVSGALVTLMRGAFSLHGQGNPALEIQALLLAGFAIAILVFLARGATATATMTNDK